MIHTPELARPLDRTDIGSLLYCADDSRIPARVTANGNDTNASSRDPNFFTVTFHPGKNKETLLQVTIDINPAGLEFDATSDFGFPLTFGKLVGISPSSITSSVRPESFGMPAVSLFFAKKSFTAGTSVSFGIDRDFIGQGGGNGADLLQNATIYATTTKSGLQGTIMNTFGFGYTVLDGFGLIDAPTAAAAVP